MSGAKGPNTKKEQTDGKIKEWEGVQHMRQDAHEQLKMQGRKGPSKVIYPSSHGVITLQ
jgi:hypothetical protein